MERFKKFIDLTDKAIEIYESEASWKIKYELIFSPEISRAIGETNVRFDYEDPDGSYQDDVESFVYAVREKAEELRKSGLF